MPVTLDLQTGEKLACDSPAKAVDSLNELGLCMNWAQLTIHPSFGLMLLYQGWVYIDSYGREVCLPAPVPSGTGFGPYFEDLLWLIFKPFLLTDDAKRSIISVKQAPSDDTGTHFFVDLLLFFGNSLPEIASSVDSALSKVEDSSSYLPTKVYILD